MEAQKCEGIKRGEGMNIYDIAAEAGTSISTVSRVLNNKGNVNPKIRDSPFLKSMIISQAP